MKHSSSMGVAFGFLGIVLVCAPSCSKQEPAAARVVVTFLSGSATATSGGEERALAVAGTLSGQDRVTTGAGSVVDLVSSTQVAIRLLERSDFAVSDLLQDRMRVNVADGNILVKVGRLERGKSLDVVTPTAIASVRGTQFWGQVKKGDASGVFAVREGSISVRLRKTGETIAIEKGEALQIEPGAASMKKRPAATAELQAMQQIDQLKL